MNSLAQSLRISNALSFCSLVHNRNLWPNKFTLQEEQISNVVVARRKPKNSLEKSITLEKARRRRLHKYWPFSRALSNLGQGPRVDNAM